MTASLRTRIGIVTGIVAMLALLLAGLALFAASRMDLAVRQLLLSQSQLESALRLQAAPRLPAADVDRLLARYSDQIEAEDRIGAGALDHRRQQAERQDLARLRAVLAGGGDGAALDALAGRIVRREQAETEASRRQLARTEHMIALGASAIGLVLLLCALLFVAMLRASILRPIRLLVGGVAALREGRAEPIPRRRLPREFDLLAGGFNAMAAHIRAQRDALLALNETLEERVAARTRALAEMLGLQLDRDMRLLSCNGRRTELTERECALLGFLLERKAKTVSRAQILQAAWQASEEASDNLVDVYIGYLRRKLAKIAAPWEIVTVRGAGFALRERPAAAAQDRGRMADLRNRGPADRRP